MSDHGIVLYLLVDGKQAGDHPVEAEGVVVVGAILQN